ncbi:stress-induced protein [Candidatus Parcubacteria bacterium]|nr:stress-induced protein [Candidatus Parcubacteria bacterium]
MSTATRGFASMSRDRLRQIAAKGGRNGHLMGKAHEFTTETAAIAGRKGGATVSKDRNHMIAIGRKGAKVRNGILGS